jgi:exoribonuclease-2
MNVFFEEDGNFKVASIMTETQGSMQIESASGKRSKLKVSNVLMRFEAPLTGFLEAANIEAETLDLDFYGNAAASQSLVLKSLQPNIMGANPRRLKLPLLPSSCTVRLYILIARVKAAIRLHLLKY